MASVTADAPRESQSDSQAVPPERHAAAENGRARARKRRNRTWLALGIALLGGVPALALAWRSYHLERAMCFPERSIAASARESGLPDAQDVSFRSSEAVLYGWLLPTRNGAAVALFHGAGGNRASLAAEARALHEAGFGVLLAELPGHGRSEGQITWGNAEEHAISAALEFLSRQAGVDAGRVGALGFSLGGYVLARVAARDQRIRATVLASTPSDLSARIRHTHQRWGSFGATFARMAFLRAGTDPDADLAQDFIGRIAPRAVMIITSEQDDLVPQSMAQKLYSEAGEPKTLLVIPGKGHGGYSERSPLYATKLVEFFSRELAPRGLEKNQ